jgi:hypothetical protein
MQQFPPYQLSMYDTNVPNISNIPAIINASSANTHLSTDYVVNVPYVSNIPSIINATNNVVDVNNIVDVDEEEDLKIPYKRRKLVTEFDDEDVEEVVAVEASTTEAAPTATMANVPTEELPESYVTLTVTKEMSHIDNPVTNDDETNSDTKETISDTKENADTESAEHENASIDLKDSIETNV